MKGMHRFIPVLLAGIAVGVGASFLFPSWFSQGGEAEPRPIQIGASGGLDVAGGRPTVALDPAERKRLFDKLAGLPEAHPAAKIVPKLVIPSVVNIAVRRARSAGNLSGAPAKGSGFILDRQGHIGTNYHVVEHGRAIRVTTYDGRVYDAVIRGVDKKTDLAVLKINAKNLIPVKMGDSAKMEVGDPVMAIGNAFGNLSHTVTHGIVSAIGRNQVDVIASRYRYENFIQTDTAINKGNSGGPLINMRGEVVGINTAILSGSGGFEGVGLAAPINQARFVFDQLVRTGQVVRGWLGVEADHVDAALVLKVTGKTRLQDALKALSLEVAAGVYVSRVHRGTPAAKARPPLRNGDIIFQYDGWTVTHLDAFRDRVARSKVGKTVTLRVLRKGSRRKIQVKIGKQPKE